MKITKFLKLTEIVLSLGADPGITKLDAQLKAGEVDVDHERLIYGDNGVYYLREDGVLTKVLVHIVDKSIRYVPEYLLFVAEKNNDYNSVELIQNFHKYHILGCSTLEQAKSQGWRDKYKMSNNTNGIFMYRLLENNLVKIKLDNQKLNCCKNCIKKYELTTNKKFSLEEFMSEGLTMALNANEFQSSKYAKPNIYSNDWDQISNKYKNDQNWICEGCGIDCSLSELKRYLHCHHKNMDKSNNRYANLEALCIKCHSEQPGHSQLNNNPDLLRFEKLTKVYKEG
ncbi:MAG: HNH endonuclease [Xanthomonadales bacterium]|nr:HNH endonuclease [Xanthomonadales bacterium]